MLVSGPSDTTFDWVRPRGTAPGPGEQHNRSNSTSGRRAPAPCRRIEHPNIKNDAAHAGNHKIRPPALSGPVITVPKRPSSDQTAAGYEPTRSRKSGPGITAANPFVAWSIVSLPCILTRAAEPPSFHVVDPGHANASRRSLDETDRRSPAGDGRLHDGARDAHPGGLHPHDHHAGGRSEPAGTDVGPSAEATWFATPLHMHIFLLGFQFTLPTQDSSTDEPTNGGEHMLVVRLMGDDLTDSAARLPTGGSILPSEAPPANAILSVIEPACSFSDGWNSAPLCDAAPMSARASCGSEDLSRAAASLSRQSLAVRIDSRRGLRFVTCSTLRSRVSRRIGHAIDIPRRIAANDPGDQDRCCAVDRRRGGFRLFAPPTSRHTLRGITAMTAMIMRATRVRSTKRKKRRSPRRTSTCLVTSAMRSNA